MKFEREIEKLFFIILGTFITSSYSRDFTLLELVRKPLQFPISKNGNYFVAKIPKGLPWQETVVILGDVFATKTKDIPIRKGIQKKPTRLMICLYLTQASLTDCFIRMGSVIFHKDPLYIIHYIDL